MPNAADIRRCPLTIANDHHYRQDGSCLCGPRCFVLASSVLSSCPVGSLLPSHWSPDGTCECRRPVALVQASGRFL